jgi:hypothetical protein
MATTTLDLPTAERALAVLDELIAYQQKRVLALAQKIRPGLTEEDVRNVHDFPDVYGDPQFQFEDGQLAGFVAAKIALKSRLLVTTIAPPA